MVSQEQIERLLEWAWGAVTTGLISDVCKSGDVIAIPAKESGFIATLCDFSKPLIMTANAIILCSFMLKASRNEG